MNWLCWPCQRDKKVMPDDHSEVVPLLPIPNRTVKRLCADDSAGSRVKVGHRQAVKTAQRPGRNAGPFALCTPIQWFETVVPSLTAAPERARSAIRDFTQSWNDEARKKRSCSVPKYGVS